MDTTPLHDEVARGTTYLCLYRAGDGVVVQRVDPSDNLPDFWQLWLRERIDKVSIPQDGLVVQLQDDTVVVVSAMVFDDMASLVRACLSGIEPHTSPMGSRTVDGGEKVKWHNSRTWVEPLLRGFELPDGASLSYGSPWVILNCGSRCRATVFDLAVRLEEHVALGQPD